MSTHVATTKQSTSTSDLVGLVPTGAQGAQAGDVAWLFWIGSDTVTWTDPAGWTKRSQSANEISSPSQVRRYTKTLTSGDLGSSVTLATSGGQKQISFVHVRRGVDTANPEAAITPAQLLHTATQATRSLPTVTTSDVRDLIGVVGDRGPAGGTWTPPTSWTELADELTPASGSVSGSLAHRNGVPAGTYGGVDFTSSTASQTRAITSLVVVNDAAPTVANTTTAPTNVAAAIIRPNAANTSGGTLSYSIAQVSGATTAPQSLGTGAWAVPRHATDTLVYDVTITHSGGAPNKVERFVVAAQGVSGTPINMYLQTSTVIVPLTAA